MLTNRSTPGEHDSDGMNILPAVTVAVLIAIYPLLRFGGWWNPGGDSINFVNAIRSVQITGELVPFNYSVYPNGYGFQALSVFLLDISGLSLAEWQTFGASLMVVWIVFPAWLLYREWVGSSGGATLATLLLFIQAEFLFGVMRGTHEKFTRGLMLLALFLLIQGLRSRNVPRRAAGSILAFYLVTFALITFNNLFSTSFIAAVLLSLVMVLLLGWRNRMFPELSVVTKKLLYVVSASLLLAFIYTFFVYSPARDNLTLLQTIADRIAALLLPTTESEGAFNPYSRSVHRAWVSPYIYFLLGIGNLLLFVGSVTIWSVQSVRWFFGRSRPESEADVLLWSFYGAFLLQGGLAVLADLGGALSGNLQHRMFPTIGIIGAAVIARQLEPLLRAERTSRVRVAQIGMGGFISVLLLLALFKATKEPVFSNEWRMYRSTEVQAIEWADRALADRSIWTGYDRRLVEAMRMQSEGESLQVLLDRIEVDDQTDNILVSRLVRHQANRLGQTLPTQSDDLITFDNGDVQIHHRRPETEYHR